MHKVDESDSVVHLWYMLVVCGKFHQRRHTSVDLGLLHAFTRHGVVANNLRERRGREVLLARLFLGAVLP